MRSPFSSEVYIRVSENGLVCTTKRGWLPRRVTVIPMHPPSERDTDAELAPKRDIRWPRSVLGLTDTL